MRLLPVVSPPLGGSFFGLHQIDTTIFDQPIVIPPLSVEPCGVYKESFVIHIIPGRAKQLQEPEQAPRLTVGAPQS